MTSRVSTGVADAAGMTPEEMAAFLNTGAADHSPYLDALREAGGNKKVQMSDKVNARLNLLTGQTLVKACVVCGVFGDVRACGNCNSVMYCSKVCQKQHWKEHKTSCKLYANNTKLSVNTGFNASKWFNSMPGMVEHLQSAVAMGNRLPVVQIVVGENERKCVIGLGGCDTQEDLEVKKGQYPESVDLFRFDKEEMPGGMYRVVVVIQHKSGNTVMRMRV